MKKFYVKILMSVVLFLLGITTTSNAQESINFKNITIDDGLSQGTVQALMQDSKGRIWIGSNDGLNMYNGYEFKIYTQKKDQEKGIVNNYILDIEEDNEGNIWVATIGGISKINTENDTISNYYQGKSCGNLSNNNIYTILISKSGDIIIGTSNGIDIYDKTKDEFRKYNIDIDKLESKRIYAIEEDENSDIWIGTKTGLYKLDKENGEIKEISTEDSNENDLHIYKIYFDSDDNVWIGAKSENLYKLDNNKLKKYPLPYSNKVLSVRDIIQDDKKDLWIATDEGLVKYNIKKNKFRSYQRDIYETNALVDNNLYCIMKDSTGLLWLGTYSGISMFEPNNNIKYYKHDGDIEDKVSISENMVSGIYKDNEGLLWIGTKSTGVNIFDRENDKIRYLTTEEGLSCNNIYDIEGNGDLIFISTDDGVNIVNKKDNTIKKYDKSNGLEKSNVRSILIDDNDYVWLGTTEGVVVLNIKTGEIKDLSIIEDRFHIKDKFNGCLYKDSKGTYWIGYFLDGGLLKLDPKTNKSKLYKMKGNDTNSISNNSVKSISEDSKGNLWIGTNFGLNKFDKDTEKFERYMMEDGLPNNTIYGIIIDKKDHIWVSTNYGISKFDSDKNEFANFGIVDGLQGRAFNGKSFHLSYDNEIFFGGTNGLNSFRCEELQKKKNYINLEIQTIYVNEKKYNNIENLKFKYYENNINVEMFLPYYKNVKGTKYYYKLDKIDREFKEFKGNKLSLVNLSPGKYTLRLKALNSNVAMSQEETIDFTIKPPFWMSKTALIIYIVIVIFCILYYKNKVKLLDTMVNKRTRALTNEIERNEELFKKVLKLEKNKNSYFVNLSHELRTPLNVISSTEQLITRISNKKGIGNESLAYHMGVIKKNSERLLELITNLMDIEKIEYGKYKLNKEKQDIVEVIEDEALRLKNHIECNGIEIVIDPEVEEKIVSFDKNEIKRCIENLISNAVKFTPEGGTIEIVIKDLDEKVMISVEDNGIGIDEKNQKIIFDRFRQVVDANEEIQNSSGLGLTITRDIIKLHGGEIYLESKIGKGSKFTIVLPVE
ncbi:MAG: ligand-binding sensor domain-containing protein [Paraclostridium sp.]|uniref:ligand-binding sensor domain-containing protein n=1 Tax=Paraclostridium sp. TaxID=2023273 RepID=UPI003F316DB2